MEILIIAALIGLIPAAIAQGKGKSFFLWWIYGAAIFIVALPHALIMRADDRAIEKQTAKFRDEEVPKLRGNDQARCKSLQALRERRLT